PEQPGLAPPLVSFVHPRASLGGEGSGAAGVSTFAEKRAMFTSMRPDWRTPFEFYRQLDAEFGFALDAASDGRNAYGVDWLTPHDNALWRSWAPGPTFCNPPYGRRLGEWVEK